MVPLYKEQVATLAELVMDNQLPFIAKRGDSPRLWMIVKVDGDNGKVLGYMIGNRNPISIHLARDERIWTFKVPCSEISYAIDKPILGRDS